MKLLVFFCVLSFPTAVFTGSHSLRFLVTYIEGETPFPTFSVLYMLDDIIVGYYDSKMNSYVPRGNTTNEDEEVDYINYSITKYMRPFISAKFLGKISNKTEGPVVFQIVNLCEVLEKDKPGQMITKFAFEGSTTEEMCFIDDILTYQGIEKPSTLYLEMYKWRHVNIGYPLCTTNLRSYLKKRGTQWKRRVKPRVRLIQKANSDSGGFRVSCLATGFYPRHINLTLFRDGQPVSDHEITGGDLLPNGDGTYQMRKSLEISADEHKYTCSATHLSLDNKLDVTLEFDPGEPFKSVIPSVLIVLALMLVFGTGVLIYKCRRRRAASSKSDYSAASTSEDSYETTSTQNTTGGLIDDYAYALTDWRKRASITNSFIPRGNTTNEDEEVDHINYGIAGRFVNKTESPAVQQIMGLCEVSDNDKPGQMITRIAFDGSTTYEMSFIDNTLTHRGVEQLTTLHLEIHKWRYATVYYPRCTTNLRKYFKKRGTQGKRIVKPKVRLLQKQLSSGFRVSCLATGFYPRHINLTLFRDGQPVSDHEITGGDLLPNGDGTYQMRKSLEISADEHKYTCSATHLSLDNKLDYDHGEPFKSVIPSVLTVLALMIVFGAAAFIWKRQCAEHNVLLMISEHERIPRNQIEKTKLEPNL
ncbi:H-2 class I histocompatibility antigen, D-D alpha chain-like [Chanodichthys erythropterus]|uniref:H-2 class I histocompatibility antigen, D-D alpha chain-like n=1 Tax=Chanodichthys erythropterus TaxID=933992 RepID=UPI00351E7CBF